jgi:hypothetical protein
MKSLPWERAKRVAEVRDQIWSYVTPASRFERMLLVAAALLKWPEADALRLGELQFLLSAEVDAFLGAMPRLARRLATSSAREEQWSNERIHGPVQWNRTLSLRAATGSRQLFVTAPAERVYQTPENELLVHVLDAIVDVARSSGWDQSTSQRRPARMVRRRLSDAERWQQSRMLSSVERTPPTSRTLARIRSGRTRQRYAPVLAAHERLVSLVEQPDRQAIRSAVENAALVAAHDPTLFHLVTTFRLMEELRAHGWPLTQFQFHQESPYAQGRRNDGRQLHLWYDSTPKDLGAGSQYKQTLAAHGFSGQRDLRPDIVLNWTDPGGHIRWLLIECKLYGTVETAARQALADLLSYRRAFEPTLAGAGTPYGLGVAWGAELEPTSTKITLCTPDKLRQAVQRIVH